MQFSKMQPRRTCVSRRRYDGSGAELDGGVTRSAVSKTAGTAGREARTARRPLPQNRAVKTGAHDVSVVPVTARLMIELRRALVSWLVHQGRGGVVKPIGQCST